MTEMIQTPAHPREPSMRQMQVSAVRPGYHVLTYVTDVEPRLHAVVLASEETGGRDLYATEVEDVTSGGDLTTLVYHHGTQWTFTEHAIVWGREPEAVPAHDALADVRVQRVLARLPKRLDETVQVRVSTAWLTALDETVEGLRAQGYDADRSALIRAAVEEFIGQVS